MANPQQEIASSPSDLSDSGSESDDSQYDPSFGIVDDIESSLSRLSINRSSKARGSRQKDEKDEPNLDDIIQAGNLEKLKVEQCKVYLRKHGLRLTGNKETLIQRIKEHLEISNGDGERKYPASSFVLNCKGDACTGDVVLFEQNVYEMFSIASRSATGPPCGTRMVAGRIIKESYGTAKQQHTFTIEVVWSKGEKPLPPLHPLLIKGRNLYRLKTMRQKWEDEGKRQKMLDEKHARGFVARSNREARVTEKEMRKKMKTNRVVDARYNPGKAGNNGINQHQQQPPKMQDPILECMQKENPAFRAEPRLKVDYCSETLHSQRQPLSSKSCNNRPGTQISQQHHYTVNNPFNSGQPGHSTSVNQITSNKHANFNYQRPPATYHHQASKSSDAARSSFLEPPYGGSRLHVPHEAARVDRQMPCHHDRNERFNKDAEHHLAASSTSNKNVQQVCRFYPQGRCYYGDVCKYLHVMKQGN